MAAVPESPLSRPFIARPLLLSREVVTEALTWIKGSDRLRRDERSTCCQRKDSIMTILPMMRGGAVAIVLASAMLVQGCASSGPRVQQASLLTDTGPTTGTYSGQAWYADLYHVMTTEQGGE